MGQGVEQIYRLTRGLRGGMTKGIQGPSLICQIKEGEGISEKRSWPGRRADRAGVLAAGYLEAPWVLSRGLGGVSGVLLSPLGYSVDLKYESMIEKQEEREARPCGRKRVPGECSGRVSLL